MPWYDDKTYVIKSRDPERLKAFFEDFGLTFVPEQHGDGPVHFACASPSGKVFEIYPRKA